MIENSTEAKAAAAKIKLIYKVARIAFFEAMTYVPALRRWRPAIKRTFCGHWRMQTPHVPRVSFKRRCLGNF
jgi:hypothetical protein